MPLNESFVINCLTNVIVLLFLRYNKLFWFLDISSYSWLKISTVCYFITSTSYVMNSSNFTAFCCHNLCHYKYFKYDVTFNVKRLLTIKGCSLSIFSIGLLPHRLNEFCCFSLRRGLHSCCWVVFTLDLMVNGTKMF